MHFSKREMRVVSCFAEANVFAIFFCFPGLSLLKALSDRVELQCFSSSSGISIAFGFSEPGAVPVFQFHWLRLRIAEFWLRQFALKL
jgi:hypothetical protein